MRTMVINQSPMSRTFLSLLLLTTTLIAFGQKPKKVTTYTPVTLSLIHI